MTLRSQVSPTGLTWRLRAKCSSRHCRIQSPFPAGSPSAPAAHPRALAQAPSICKENGQRLPPALSPPPPGRSALRDHVAESLSPPGPRSHTACLDPGVTAGHITGPTCSKRRDAFVRGQSQHLRASVTKAERSILGTGMFWQAPFVRADRQKPIRCP